MSTELLLFGHFQYNLKQASSFYLFFCGDLAFLMAGLTSLYAKQILPDREVFQGHPHTTSNMFVTVPNCPHYALL